MVQARSKITKREPILFSIKELNLEDEYVITVSREIRKLKAAGLIQYKVLNARHGKYELTTTGKYSKEGFVKILIAALVALEKQMKPSTAREVRKMLDDASGNISQASTKIGQGSR
jgi:predicted MarR family transcription regulator